jgi:antitoxin MazE
MQIQVARWGNSLAVRIPKEIAADLGLAEGSRVEVAANDGRIVITLARPRYSLDELLRGMTPEAMHEALDWSADRGRENVDK